jgi:hypothetical protein
VLTQIDLNRQKLFPLLENPERTHLRDAGWLNELAATYPYSPLVHALLAKAFQHTSEEKAYVQKAALHLADRRVLKALMENRLENLSARIVPSTEAHLSPPAAEKESEIAEEVTSGESTTQKFGESDVVKELEENLARLRKQREELMDYLGESENASEEVSASEGEALEASDKMPASDLNEEMAGEAPDTIALTEDETTTRQAPQAYEGLPELVRALATDINPKAISDPRKQRQINLIDSFLEQSGKLSRKYRDAQNEPQTPQTDLTQHYAFAADHTVTETMARLMEKQGRREQAIQIYEKLSLKYPDKKAYFASCIENLKHSN